MDFMDFMRFHEIFMDLGSGVGRPVAPNTAEVGARGWSRICAHIHTEAHAFNLQTGMRH